MKESKDKKITKNFVKDISSDSQKRAWVFLGGYFIFFLVIILSIRSNNNKVNTNDTSNTIKYFNGEKLKNNNYHFKYTVNIDGTITIYEGDKKYNKQLFTKTRLGVAESYYEENNIYLKQQDSSWIKSTNPYELITFNEYEKIMDILESSTYISKTEYKDKFLVYNYQISTSTLSKLLDLEHIDLDDIPNDIKVYIDSNKNLIKIDFDFSQYFKYKRLCNTNVSISLEYSKYGKITDIKNPMNN